MQGYFDLSKQIVHLAIDKSVMFERAEIDVAEALLRDNNYRNFVSCSKIKFAEFIGGKLIMYRTASFKEWKAYFDMDCRISKHLIGNLIGFERTVNSRVSHHISILMANDQLSNFEKNTVIQIIQSSQRRRLGLNVNLELENAYNGERTWEFVPELTLGEMSQLLFWFLEHKQDIYLEIVRGSTFLEKMRSAKKRIVEIIRLRNNLFHFKPLNVYITHGNSRSGRRRPLNNQFRKDAVDFIYHLNRNQKIEIELKEVFENSDNYVKIKNSQRSVG